MSENTRSIAADEIHKQIPIESRFFLTLLGVLFFLLPVKFSSSWFTGEQVSLPSGILIGLWTSYILQIIIGALLFLAVMIYRVDRVSKPIFCVWLSWLALAASLFSGFYEGEELFFRETVGQILNGAGVILIIAIVQQREETWKTYVAGGITAGLCYTLLVGLYQYYWGFAELQAYYEQQSAAGVAIPKSYKSRVFQDLVYSTFTLSNSFAAHIILCFPVAIHFLWKELKKENLKFLKACGGFLILCGLSLAFTGGSLVLPVCCCVLGAFLLINNENMPPSFYRLLVLLFAVLAIGVLALTRSRAGLVSFGAGLLVAGVFFAATKKQRIYCSLAVVIAAAPSIWLALRVPSFQVRLGYYEALLTMFKEQPLGYGFGRFSEVYNRMKLPGTEESQLPHSWFLGYLGQGGVIAALLTIVCVFMMLRILSKSDSSPVLRYACGTAIFSWLFHSLLDINIMIPASVMTFVVIAFLALNKSKEQEKARSYRVMFYLLLPLACTYIYSGVQRFRGEFRFSQIHDVLESPQDMSVSRLKDLLEKMDRVMPYAIHGYKLVGGTALRIFKGARGLSDIQRGDYLNLSEECLLEVQERSPQSSIAHYLLSQVYVNKKDNDKALQCINQAVELRPGHGGFLNAQKAILFTLYRRERQSSYYRAILLNSLRSLDVGLGSWLFQLKSGQLDSGLKNKLRKLAEECFTLKKSFKELDDESPSEDLETFQNRLLQLEAGIKQLKALKYDAREQVSQ
ncbi:MAG: O-antigen ligase family protein [Lentisphaeraceae bacterium]|nr:O-antigen ligase family protein [Lentisphaeraceae bacterium]